MRDWPAGSRCTLVLEDGGVGAAAGAVGGVLTATGASCEPGVWVRKTAPTIVTAASDHARRKGQRRLGGTGGCGSMTIVRYTIPTHGSWTWSVLVADAPSRPRRPGTAA